MIDSRRPAEPAGHPLGAAAHDRRPHARASSIPRTSPARTTFRSICCASTATRSSRTSMRTSCWCAAPGSAPRRPRRRCAQAGLTNVHILDGGITAWEGKEFAVNRGVQRWDLERQVRLVAGLIVSLSILASILVPGVKWVAVRDRRWAGRRGADQHLCDGHVARSRLPYNRGAMCDVRTIVAQLVDAPPSRRRRADAMIALTIVLAVFVGVSLGLLGGGGSILTVPLLAYVAGLEAKQAIATSLLVVGVTSAVGAFSHARAGRVQWRTGLVFGAAGMAGAYAGGLLARFIPGTVLLIGFAVIMIATAVAMLRGRRDISAVDAPRSLPLFKIILEGLIVGLVTGLVGAGGGFLVVPALALLGGLPMPVAVGTVVGRRRDELIRRAGRLSLQRAHRLARWPSPSPPPRLSAG